MTSTGTEGPASWIRWPCSSTIARTLPETVPAMNGFADLERAVLDENRGDDPACAVELGLQHDAGARVVPGLALSVFHVGDEQDHLQQLIETDALLGRDLAGDHVAAVLLDHEPRARSAAA